MKLFERDFPLDLAVRKAAEDGYALWHAIPSRLLRELEGEGSSLPLVVADHKTHPLNAGRPNEVRQVHARAYYQVGDPAVPVFNKLAAALGIALAPLAQEHPCLADWTPTEGGYQLYREGTEDWISPHRDRRSDRALSLTITITGSAIMRFYRQLGASNDYTKLECIDERRTRPGTLLLLRAPGLGNGEQIVHEVLPPEGEGRLILNLRTRSSVLPAPAPAQY